MLAAGSWQEGTHAESLVGATRGITAVPPGGFCGFCEHIGQVLKLVDMFATRAGPEAGGRDSCCMSGNDSCCMSGNDSCCMSGNDSLLYEW
jgi:hypothetical protein